MELPLGTLTFTDGVPTDPTVAKVSEGLGFTRAGACIGEWTGSGERGTLDAAAATPRRHESARARRARTLMAETRTSHCLVVSFEIPKRDYHAYHEVEEHCYETASIRMFDAAVAGRQTDGRFKNLGAPARRDRGSLSPGGHTGVPSGLVVALSPAAAVGTPLDAGAASALDVLAVLTWAVSGGLSQSKLEGLGTELDAGGAAPVVVTFSGRADELRLLIEGYGRAGSAFGEIDMEALGSDLHQDEQERRADAEA